MNVNKVSGYVPLPGVDRKGKVSDGNTFARALEKAMDTVHCEEAFQETPRPVTEVTPTAAPNVSHADQRTVERASKVLDLLEEYVHVLNDPQRTLKSIEPVVIQMEQELKGLNVQSVPCLGQRNELARLINQIAVTTSVEAFKFQRGDYVA